MVSGVSLLISDKVSSIYRLVIQSTVAFHTKRIKPPSSARSGKNCFMLPSPSLKSAAQFCKTPAPSTIESNATKVTKLRGHSQTSAKLGAIMSLGPPLRFDDGALHAAARSDNTELSSSTDGPYTAISHSPLATRSGKKLSSSISLKFSRPKVTSQSQPHAIHSLTLKFIHKQLSAKPGKRSVGHSEQSATPDGFKAHIDQSSLSLQTVNETGYDLLNCHNVVKDITNIDSELEEPSEKPNTKRRCKMYENDRVEKAVEAMKG